MQREGIIVISAILLAKEGRNIGPTMLAFNSLLYYLDSAIANLDANGAPQCTQVRTVHSH